MWKQASFFGLSHNKRAKTKKMMDMAERGKEISNQPTGMPHMEGTHANTKPGVAAEDSKFLEGHKTD